MQGLEEIARELETKALALDILEDVQFSFGTCQRTLNNETIRGRTCEATEGTLYHHTEMRNLPSIRQSGELRPGGPPFGDGTVNFSSSPNYHRFGSLRFVVDKDKADVVPMCYTSGDQEKKRMEVRERYQEELREQSDVVSPNRIENLYMGAESWEAWKNECKHYSRQPVPLRDAVKAVEYWVPWKTSEFGAVAVGPNVSPCHASWGAWETGRSPETNLQQIREEIAAVRSYTEELGVPFRVRSCYPYVSLSTYEVIRLNSENLRRLEAGEDPVRESRYQAELSEECTCPDERIPEGDLG